jgi:hypothetical protein
MLIVTLWAVIDHALACLRLGAHSLARRKTPTQWLHRGCQRLQLALSRNLIKRQVDDHRDPLAPNG